MLAWQRALSWSATASETQHDQLHQALAQLIPWRKGPIDFFGLLVDSEWRSDWKWARVLPWLDLSGASVLDIGAGNGYYGWRMLEAGARQVVGVDPTVVFLAQHLAVQHFARDPRNQLLPLRMEDLPACAQPFDAVFSMGVLYHRRDPTQHLAGLRRHLATGGQLILETLITTGDADLTPTDRYARMRNVWCVPTLASIVRWLEHAKFTDVATVDVTPTTSKEQRSTAWMPFESLAQALDPLDASRTIEGLPAPIRAVICARAA